MRSGIGIDVSKATLDVAVHETGETRRVANTAAGWRSLARWLLTLQPRQVVLEATGGYERAALAAMRYEPRLRDFYQGLRARGKPAKVAIVAVMRKLLVILNARMRDALKEDAIVA